MGQLLDLAVIGIAILVSLTLALLAWTLGVSAVRAVGRARRRVLVARLLLARAERNLAARMAGRSDPGSEGDA